MYFSCLIHASMSYSLAGPTNSPAVGGAVITVTGPILQPISIAIGVTSCASLAIIAVDAVACRIAAGTGASLDVKAYSQTFPSYFSYDLPFVSKCSVVSAAGGLLYLTGKNFGTNQLTGNRTLNAKVSGMAVSSRWLSDSSLVMMAPAGAGRTMDFMVLNPLAFHQHACTLSLCNSMQVTVDGTSCLGNCIYTDWQNQWLWESDGADPASTLAARVYSCMVNFTSGQLLVFGGLVDAAANNETWVYEPLARAGWRLITALPSPFGRWSAACYSDGGILYMHGGVADDASVLSDLWSFNITSLKWSQLLPLTCNSNPLTCTFAARSHVLVKFMSSVYAWDTLGGRFARFNLTSSAWESLIVPSVQRFQYLSAAQISSEAFVLLGLKTDATSNVLYVMKFSPEDPVDVQFVNTSQFPLVTGGCMLAFSSQILVLGGKSTATSNGYR
jgi:hypothetical protein